jgi:serine/threonine protein kinase
MVPPITFEDGGISGVANIFDPQYGHPSALSNNAKQLIGRLLEPDPSKRPTPAQAMNLRWFRSQRNKRVLTAATPRKLQEPKEKNPPRIGSLPECEPAVGAV